ncbi:MAG: hypothetical protein ACEROO_11310 [Candidatus Bathyarchaeota archaeon]
MQLENRKVQLNMQLLDWFASEENMLRSAKVLEMEFEDFADLKHKWGMNANPEGFAKRIHVLSEFDVIGHLVSEGYLNYACVAERGKKASLLG